MSSSSIIRHPRIDDEPVVISTQRPDLTATGVLVDAQDAETDEMVQPDAPDPLAEREEMLRQRAEMLERWEVELAERRGEVESTLEQLTELVRNARAETVALMKEAERQAIDLALAVARRVVRGELRMHRDVVVRVVEEALEAVGRQIAVCIRVAPEDEAVLRGSWGTAAQAAVSRGVEIIADPKIHKGGCVIETQAGTIDGRIESQLEAIEAVFHNLERENRATEA